MFLDSLNMKLGFKTKLYELKASVKYGARDFLPKNEYDVNLDI